MFCTLLLLDALDNGFTVLFVIFLFWVAVGLVLLISLNNLIHGIIQKDRKKTKDALPFLIVSSILLSSTIFLFFFCNKKRFQTAGFHKDKFVCLLSLRQAIRLFISPHIQ